MKHIAQEARQRAGVISHPIDNPSVALRQTGMRRMLTPLGCVLVAWLLTLMPARAANPVLELHVDRAILVLSDKAGETRTRISVTPLNFPSGARLSYSWKQVQDEMSPLAADMARKKIGFDPADGPEITATFPDSGVYEIRLTVTDSNSRLTASRNTWVNVWNNRSNILKNGAPDPLAVAPGLLPPPHVRNLSPNPAPSFIRGFFALTPIGRISMSVVSREKAKSPAPPISPFSMTRILYFRRNHRKEFSVNPSVPMPRPVSAVPAPIFSLELPKREKHGITSVKSWTNSPMRLFANGRRLIPLLTQINGRLRSKNVADSWRRRLRVSARPFSPIVGTETAAHLTKLIRLFRSGWIRSGRATIWGACTAWPLPMILPPRG